MQLDCIFCTKKYIFALMKLNRKIIIQCMSMLMLLIYLYGSSSIFSFHNHNDDDHHHDLLFCENLHQDLSHDSDCDHNSHIISLKERCAICDHFLNFKPAILERVIKSNIKLYTTKRCELFVSLFLNSPTNTLNKSPPFII